MLKEPDRRRSHLRLLLARWIPIGAAMLPIMTAILGGLFTVVRYIDQRALTERSAQIARLLEAQKPFLDRQTALFFETAKVVGALMTLDPTNSANTQWSENETRYWALYYSELAMVENCAVDSAMAAFGSELKQFRTTRDDVSKERLGRRAVSVAHALRTGMAESWTGQISPKGCELTGPGKEDISKTEEVTPIKEPPINELPHKGQ
jgi:hypothetical protein